MAVPLRVLVGRRQLVISQASFLPGSAERSDVLMVPAEERRQLHLDKMVLRERPFLGCKHLYVIDRLIISS